MTAAPSEVTLAITGASGFQYGWRLLDVLLSAGIQVHLLLSRAAHVVASEEADIKLPGQAAALGEAIRDAFPDRPGTVQVWGREDWLSPVASGSGAPTTMVVCPCSTGTLSAIACGASDNLIERAADVVLKERKRLILVVRETPLSSLHLENMLKLSREGVVILPAAPGFYHKPQRVEDMIDFIVARILNQIGVPHQLMPAWGREGRA